MISAQVCKISKILKVKNYEGVNYFRVKSCSSIMTAALPSESAKYCIQSYKPTLIQSFSLCSALKATDHQNCFLHAEKLRDIISGKCVKGFTYCENKDKQIRTKVEKVNSDRNSE